MIIVVTSLMFFVYFPEHGGMLIPKGALKSYDPQIIKPPAGYRGADSMDFENAEKVMAEQQGKSTTKIDAIEVTTAQASTVQV